MTPDEARRLLDNFDRLLPFEAELEMDGAAKDMAAMIANMREEWGVEERHEYTGEWAWHSTHPDRESACNAVNGMDHFRVARRYVTEPEVTE